MRPRPRRPPCPARPCSRPRPATGRSRSTGPPQLQRGLGRHGLQRLPGNQRRRREPRHRGVQWVDHDLHRDRPHQRHPLLLQGVGYQRGRRQRPVQRGLGHPGHRARRAHRPDRNTRGRPGHAELDRAVIQRWLGHHRLQGLRGNRRRRRERRHRGVQRVDHDLHRDRPHQRHPLLLRGAGHQRGGRQRPVQRGVGHPGHGAGRAERPGRHARRRAGHAQLDRPEPTGARSSRPSTSTRGSAQAARTCRPPCARPRRRPAWSPA